MKKLTLFITTLLLSLVLVFAFGCNDQPKKGPIVCKDGEHQAQLTLELDSEDLNVYNKGVCEICGSEVKQFVGYGAVSSNTASKAINEYASSGDVVYLTTGTYSSVINVYTDNDVTITAFPGQTIKAKGFKIQTQASITIDGINFEVSYDSGGINFAGNNKNVTIKNCNFKGNAYITNETHAHEVKNLLVENCTFTNYKKIGNNNANIACGIYLTSPNDLTVRNCTFQTQDGARYAICGGEGGGATCKGNIIVEGCTFINSGTRVIRLYDTEQDCLLTFKDNVVYEHDGYITVANNASSAFGNHGRAIVYINSWETVPSSTEVKTVVSGFTVVYNQAEQKTID